ncbi:DUF5686 and carboxypeptidase regulatory-like domain-containing protein [Niabella pedocola]|uniref:DUF5686 and carboxypeptidase regulatory-like domain-containing protein n=1 Tax=Niabella pedocola TaxID=1752077 RepID=A0ABS8PVW0_9BACT|nr:DUF5686 family protein [Niabella pedocola]MCD2425204.1 DUF5686 and carboxypeptidase regulatory-like domain-containing protein [Niabella pedocola]
MRMMRLVLLCWIVLLQVSLRAQNGVSGVIRDKHSEELVPFVSFQFKNTNTGFIADSAGNFHFETAQWPSDTLEISNVGYETQLVPVSALKKEMIIYLEPRTYDDGVVVKAKIDLGLWLWKNIVKHKPENDRFRRFDNFYYELYNKMEMDLKNIRSIQKIANIKPFRPMNDLIKKNLDSSEGVKVLPTYLTESLSDYYFQKRPLRRREEIKGVNTNGIKNESMVKFLGGMDQVINIYNDFINVFNKEFISPVSSNGDFYYKYNVSDTQRIGGIKYYHLVFIPRRQGMNTFEGDCWVEGGSFAVQKMNLRLDKKADINFLDRLSLIQEYKKINDSTWFISKDKLVVDFSPFNNRVPGVIGRKTSTYQHVLVNDTTVRNRLLQNKTQEEIIVKSGSGEKDRLYWDSARHEGLTTTELGIIKMMDTIVNAAPFRKITRQVGFLATGYINIGNVELGSAYNWFTGNSWEGFRTRFDIASNKHFNKKFRWHTYLAYGFGDKKLKGEGELFYLPKKDPRRYWYLGYKKDLDFGQVYFGEITSDNIFAFAIRKPNIPLKFISLEKWQLEFFNETRGGFSTLLGLNARAYTPLKNLVPADSFGTGNDPLRATEISLRLRYAFQEKFIESHFYRSSLGSPYPIVEATISKGVSGLLNGRYNYTKVQGSVSDNIKTPPFGIISYQAYGGKTFGTLPYTFLNVAPGNELYYYNKYAFNMMNRYEFIHDQFLGINFEHNIGNGIFKAIPALKFRQFYTVKALWGSLSEANKALNFKEGHTFQSLDGKTYLEVGTGIDNILRFLRVDFIWRLLPKDALRSSTEKFGVFGSIRLNL